MDYITALKEIMLDYDKFCHIAINLEWIDIQAQYEDWFYTYPLGIYLYAFEFPKGYIQNNIAHAYVRALLSRIAFDEEWDKDFWNIPLSERKECLEKGRPFYESYTTPREVRLIEQNWNVLVKEIQYFANINNVPFSKQEQFIKPFENATVIEIGGLYTGDREFLAIKDNLMLLVNNGCWD